MTRSLLIRGMIAGLVAGLLLFAVGRTLGEPQVDRAIAYETAADEARAQADAAAGHAPALPEPELVSRSNQAGLGLLTGTVVYGTAFGGLFALVFAFARGRAGPSDPRGLALMLAAAGFLAVFLVPDLKYPSNPPSVGEPDTIGLRTALYFTMMACSVAAFAAAAALHHRLRPARGAWSAGLLAAAFCAACITTAMLVLPAVQEVPDGFDAVLLWRFRMATIAMQFTMWATLGLLFGALAERLLSPAPGRLRTATR